MHNGDEDRESPAASGDIKHATTTFGDIFSTDAKNSVYYAKAQVLNDAVQDIGMGRYQVRPSYPVPTPPSHWEFSGSCSS